MANSDRLTIIEKYANRRLYNTGTFTLVTLDELAAMVKRRKNFLVYDAKTGADITQSVQAQIVFDLENSHRAR
jgi:polyhydroxyalkanoate synthesis repressor PhaR